jgi:hypothetical protein
METIEILFWAFVIPPIIGVIIGCVSLVVAHGRSRLRPLPLRSKVLAVIVFIILITFAVGEAIVLSNESPTSRRSHFVAPVISGPNLLMNPSFETGQEGLANNWKREYDPEATFSLSASGVVEGNFAQHISKIGTSKDTNDLMEIYQTAELNDTIGPGNMLVFSVYISGSISKCSIIIGIEGFENSSTWINEEDAYIFGLSDTPEMFGVGYQVPMNCSYVAAFIQFNEINSVSSVSINLDNAILVKALAWAGDL